MILHPDRPPALDGGSLTIPAATAVDYAATGEALTRATDLARVHPQAAFAQNLLGVAAAQAGQPEVARAALEHALVLDPYFPEPAANLGALLLDAGDAVMVKGSKGSKASKVVDALLKLSKANEQKE